MDEEKRLVEHANEYIKEMAKGINPLTGEIIPENDLINNVKISRCLFYASEALDKYLSTLSTTKKPKSNKKFYAVSEEFDNFKYSEKPIYVSVLTDKINDYLHNEEMKKLSATAVTSWLVSKGYLVIYQREDGKNAKKPTSLGESIGITQIIQNSLTGPRPINLYDIHAQKFIINSIEEISKSLQ